MIEVRRYSVADKQQWDDLISRSKNGTFLFYRDYMDYHADRFSDYSLLIYKKGRLEAVFPANISDNIIYSHQGLTYGGLIYTTAMLVSDVLSCFELMLELYKTQGIKEVFYKAIPYVYSNYPAQEDLYALFRCKTEIVGCNISSAILLNDKIKFSELRKRGAKKAVKNGIQCLEMEDFSLFWDVLSSNLSSRYDVKPVHSLSEISYLKEKFPKNIKLYTAQKEENIIAGVVLYINKNVVHVQYISANSEGKELGALDLLFDVLINDKYTDYQYFDFGQSTEQMGNYLNESLISQKEGFGGRGLAYNIYKINL